MPDADDIRAVDRMIAVARAQGWDVVSTSYQEGAPEIILKRRRPPPAQPTPQ